MAGSYFLTDLYVLRILTDQVCERWYAQTRDAVTVGNCNDTNEEDQLQYYSPLHRTNTIRLKMYSNPYVLPQTVCTTLVITHPL